MAITLGSNITSLAAQRQLTQSNAQLSGAFERLSSGLRINHAADDAAALALSSSLQVATRVLGQAVRNLNDALSLMSIKADAMQRLTGIIQREKELAEQAASGSYSSRQRAALNSEALALQDEYNRIVNATTFNGQALFAMSNQMITVQAGYESVTLDTGSLLPAYNGTGSFTAASTATTGVGARSLAAADFNGDGIGDLASQMGTTLQIRINNGDGTFKAPISIGTSNTSTSEGLFAADMNGDSISDLFFIAYSSGNVNVIISNGDGSFQAPVISSVKGAQGALGDVNGDNITDAALTVGGGFRVLLGNGDGTFQVSATYTAGALGQDALLIDLNDDSKLDFVFTPYSTSFDAVALAWIPTPRKRTNNHLGC